MPEMDALDVFEKIALFATAKGAAPLNKHAGCWECQVDEHWFLALNGHREPMKTTTDGKGGSGKPVEVPPFHAYVGFNGWPAGLLSPGGGTIAAGAAANLETFLAALEADHA